MNEGLVAHQMGHAASGSVCAPLGDQGANDMATSLRRLSSIRSPCANPLTEQLGACIRLDWSDLGDSGRSMPDRRAERRRLLFFGQGAWRRAGFRSTN